MEAEREAERLAAQATAQLAAAEAQALRGRLEASQRREQALATAAAEQAEALAAAEREARDAAERCGALAGELESARGREETLRQSARQAEEDSVGLQRQLDTAHGSTLQAQREVDDLRTELEQTLVRETGLIKEAREAEHARMRDGGKLSVAGELKQVQQPRSAPGTPTSRRPKVDTSMPPVVLPELADVVTSASPVADSPQQAVVLPGEVQSESVPTPVKAREGPLGLSESEQKARLESMTLCSALTSLHAASNADGGLSDVASSCAIELDWLGNFAIRPSEAVQAGALRESVVQEACKAAEVQTGRPILPEEMLDNLLAVEWPGSLQARAAVLLALALASACAATAKIEPALQAAAHAISVDALPAALLFASIGVRALLKTNQSPSPAGNVALFALADTKSEAAPCVLREAIGLLALQGAQHQISSSSTVLPANWLVVVLRHCTQEREKTLDVACSILQSCAPSLAHMSLQTPSRGPALALVSNLACMELPELERILQAATEPGHAYSTIAWHYVSQTLVHPFAALVLLCKEVTELSSDYDSAPVEPWRLCEQVHATVLPLAEPVCA